jgi:hypothetical protein
MLNTHNLANACSNIRGPRKQGQRDPKRTLPLGLPGMVAAREGKQSDDT